MDRDRFDEIAKILAESKGTDRRTMLKRLAAGSAAGLLALRGATASATKDKDKDKVLICHKPGTPAQKEQKVPASAVPGHLGHGDYLGECKDAPPPKKCGDEGDYCSKTKPCCHGYDCYDGKCKPKKTTTTTTTKPPKKCGDEGDYCSKTKPCCHGYDCYDGKCKPKK